MSDETIRRLLSDAYNTQSAGMTVGLPRVKVDASQLQALLKRHDFFKAEVERLQEAVEYEKWLRDRAEDKCEAVEDQRDAAAAERKMYHDALISRHGGEPIALLSELDQARAKIERLTNLLMQCDHPECAGLSNPANGKEER